MIYAKEGGPKPENAESDFLNGGLNLNACERSIFLPLGHWVRPSECTRHSENIISSKNKKPLHSQSSHTYANICACMYVQALEAAHTALSSAPLPVRCCLSARATFHARATHSHSPRGVSRVACLSHNIHTHHTYIISVWYLSRYTFLFAQLECRHNL